MITLCVTDHLPADFSELLGDAQREEFGSAYRLQYEWDRGIQRFEGPGERLLIVRTSGILAAIGGRTSEPDLALALRMRRFYVRPAWRRQGIGRGLAHALLADAYGSGRTITVNAPHARGTAFWEALGFRRVNEPRYTHRLDRPEPALT